MGSTTNARPSRRSSCACWRPRTGDPAQGERAASRRPRFEAVIFDLDGVLVDAEIWWDEVRMAFARRHGRVWTEADRAAIMGANSRGWSIADARSPGPARRPPRTYRVGDRRGDGRALPARGRPADPRRRRGGPPGRGRAARRRRLIGSSGGHRRGARCPGDRGRLRGVVSSDEVPSASRRPMSTSWRRPGSASRPPSVAWSSRTRSTACSRRGQRE